MKCFWRCGDRDVRTWFSLAGSDDDAGGIWVLIVTCEECSTSFQLDESRIPATGARVRCSRCKHAFFLPNPSASQAEAIDSIAAEAVGDSLANVPTPAPDLSSSAFGDAPDVDISIDTAAAADAGSPDLEEEDWQFSEEIRVEGDDESELDEELSSSGVFGSALDVEELASEGFSADDLGPADGGPAEASNSATGAEDVRDESDFGSVDDFSSLMEEDDDVAVDLGAEIESEMEIETAPAETSSDYSSTSGSTDDLGDPESWDLVGNDEFTASGSTATSAPASLLGASNASEGIDSFDSEGVVYEEEVGSASRVRETVAGIGRVAGWAVTVVMVGTVLVLGLAGEWNRGARASQTVSAGGLTAQTTSSNWVATSRSGYVLLVEGVVRNDGSESLWPGVLQLGLLDDTGARLLTEEPRPAGAPVPEIILREGTPDELVAATEAAARSFHESPIGPGETRPFTAIVFEDQLPERATRFLLEMSDPGPVTNVAAPAQAPADPAIAPLVDTQYEESPAREGPRPIRALSQLEPSAS